MDTNSPEIDQILKLQRQFKNKYRKLNQLGKVKFEKIIDFNEFKTSFETLMAQFDFRQGAMFNKNQFLENPNKRNFFYGLFKQGLLHVTLLKIDDEIIASMIGASDKKWVHLQGVNTHSPAYGKFSPGILHFYLLGDLIRKERGVFDLTPGLDEYKERWATDHDWVYTITLTQNRQFYIKRFLKKNIHSTLIKLGFKPMKVELLLEKKVYLLKKKWNLRRLNTLWKKENLIPRRLSLPLDKKFDQLSITENNLSDLLKYEETKGNLSRWEFMESVMNEMGNGKVIFSHTKDEKMVAMISFEKKETKNGPVKDDINCKNTSHTLENLYFHPDTTEEQLVSFFRSVCNTIYSKYNISEVLFLHDEKKSQLFKEIL
ncbi:GNAT family N-acetyltransferase [Lunatibacter salilacus]|uniref:GNAT family N-acetyltransferase n=1 Tax=Lunatibacter salilacus TaxID=2483804 RepID=UPI00131BE21A|nr:GNAT family N-acetyltransferase [Lunatibacter salilacus]